jgi:hypothetical protein
MWISFLTEFIGASPNRNSAAITNILAACCRDNPSFQPEGDEEQSLRAVLPRASGDLFLRRLLCRAAVPLVPNPAQIDQHPLSW